MGFSSPPPPCFVVDGFANSSSSTTALPLRTSLNGRGSSPLDDRERRLSPSGRKVVIFEAGGEALFSVTISKRKKKEEKNFEEAKRRGEQKKITPSFENEKRKKTLPFFPLFFLFRSPFKYARRPLHRGPLPQRGEWISEERSPGPRMRYQRAWLSRENRQREREQKKKKELESVKRVD